MLTPLSPEAKAWRLIAMIAIGLLILLALIETARVLLGTGLQRTASQPAMPPIGYKEVSFADLPGWEADRHSEALAPFLRSCQNLKTQVPSDPINSREALGLEVPVSLSGKVADWLLACATAENIQAAVDAEDDRAVRSFFEQYFRPILILHPAEDERNSPRLTAEGLFTGYFEPAYRASPVRTEEFPVPVLARPDDLVMVDLGAFRQEFASERIAGKVTNGRLVPYADHKKIIAAGVDAETLAWMNPNDLLFLQIQGSGKLLFDAGEMRVGYAAQNGHPYTAIGGPLIRSGAIPREQMSMQAIYNWLNTASLEEAAALRYVNESYVFFRRLDNLPAPELGPVGASGVQLTPGRSLAVDRRYHAMGAPVWIDLEGLDPETQDQRLVVAQDTGGAIKGPVRGDLFTGSGAAAADIAGRMRQSGQMYVLIPMAVAEQLEKRDGQAPTQ